MPRKLLCSLSRSTAERERGELLGLQWKDLNDNKLRIERQLFTEVLKRRRSSLRNVTVCAQWTWPTKR